MDRVHGDTCITVGCGDVDDDSRLLSVRTEEALRRAIAAVKQGRQVNVLGRVIEELREAVRLSRDPRRTGHGGSFHSGLVIPHYDSPHHDTVMEPGMTFTIEPMLALGTHEWELWDDGWTVLTGTAPGAPSSSTPWW